MRSDSELELRRQLEEPLSSECRSYPLSEDAVLVTMLDTPYYPPYIHDTLHKHNCLEIGLCVSGHGKVCLRDSVLSFSPGSLIFVPRGVYHSQINEGDPFTYWRYLIIDEEQLLRRTPERYREPIAALLESTARSGLFLESMRADSGVSDLIRLMYDMRRREGSAAIRDLELCCMLLLTLIARQRHFSVADEAEPVNPHLRQPVEPALAYIYEHYKEDIHISELAKACSMSESYFRKVFTRIMGQPPLEYINRYRVHRSLNLLRTTNDPIQSIAIRTGFASISAYNRSFKRYVAQSPALWRKKHSEDR